LLQQQSTDPKQGNMNFRDITETN